MEWLQAWLNISKADVGVVEETLQSCGAMSVSIQDAAREILLEPAPGEHPVWDAVKVIALFPADSDVGHIAKVVRRVLPDTDPDIHFEPLEDRDWSNTWRDSFQSMCFGDHLWVCPVGESPSDPGALVVSMDPGLAFGTGTHTTTALCLEWLDANPPLGKRVIDYGCGSGILAIAAHKLGAASVQAVDIDPQALTAARANAVRNGITRNFNVMLPQALPAAQVGLVLANILANPLIELADELSRRVCYGGHIILTGILEEQAGEVMTAYQSRFEFTEPVRRDGWVRLEGARR